MIDPQELLKTDPQAFVKWLRVLGLLSPFFFEKEILGFSKMVEHFHGQELERFVKNVIAGILKQGVEWARGHYKTTCFTIGLGIWFVLPWDDSDVEYAVKVLGHSHDWVMDRMRLHNTDYAQLLAFENKDNSKRKVGKIKNIFETCELFRACYPEIAYRGDENPWSREALYIRRKNRSIEDASFQSIGVGVAVQSQHFDLIWEDDCVGRKAIQSPAVMDETKEWHGQLNGAMNGAIRGMDTLRFLVSNPWGFADLNAYVREVEPDFVWHTRRCIEPGEDGIERPVFPEEFTLEKLEAIRTRGGMTKLDWAAQYMCMPIAPGDNEIDISLLHSYHVETTGQLVCDTCGTSYDPRNLRRFAHYDPYNAKATSESCPAIAVVGTSVDHHIFLLEYSMFRGDYGQIYDKIIEYNDAYFPEIWTYEDAGNQNMCEYFLREKQKTYEFRNSNHRPFRRIQPSGTKGVMKEQRIRHWFAPILEHQKFAIRASHQLFINMAQTFPFRRPNDDYDLFDALSQGALIWKFPLDEQETKDLILQEDSYRNAIGRPYGYTTRAIR